MEDSPWGILDVNKGLDKGQGAARRNAKIYPTPLSPIKYLAG